MESTVDALKDQLAEYDTAMVALSAASAGWYFVSRPSSTSGSASRVITKTLSTFLLSVLSFVRDGPHLLTGALFLGSLGDFFLALPTGKATVSFSPLSSLFSVSQSVSQSAGHSHTPLLSPNPKSPHQTTTTTKPPKPPSPSPPPSSSACSPSCPPTCSTSGSST